MSSRRLSHWFRVALAVAGLLLSVGVPQADSILDLLPGFHWRELGRIESPDGHRIAVVTHRELLGFGGSPEPPPARGRWARLKVSHNGRTVYNAANCLVVKVPVPQRTCP
jgi:hypothetical protein